MIREEIGAEKLRGKPTDLSNFITVNELMSQYFTEPFPARAAVGVAALPKGVGVEIDAVMILEQDYPY